MTPSSVTDGETHNGVIAILTVSAGEQRNSPNNYDDNSLRTVTWAGKFIRGLSRGSLSSSIRSVGSFGNVLDLMDLIAKDSREKNANGDDEGDGRFEHTFATSVPTNRYDPGVLSRVVGDLHDIELSEDETSFRSQIGLEEEEYGIDDDGLPTNNDGKSISNEGRYPVRRNSNARLNTLLSQVSPISSCRQRFNKLSFWEQTAALMVLACLIALSVPIMGVFLVIINDHDDASVSVESSLVPPAGTKDNGTTKQQQKQQQSYSISTSYTEEELFRLAERVDEACSEQQLNANMSACQHLCKGEMCCFEIEEEYSCARDREKSCLAHAGCDALVENDYSLP